MEHQPWTRYEIDAAAHVLLGKILRIAMLSHDQIDQICALIQSRHHPHQHPHTAKTNACETKWEVPKTIDIEQLREVVMHCLSGESLRLEDAIMRRVDAAFKLTARKTTFLIILAGTGCIGKSYVASQLSERFDIATMVHTKLVLRYLAAADIPQQPIRASPQSHIGVVAAVDSSALHVLSWPSTREFLDAHNIQSAEVAPAIPFDKVFREKKSMIAEGMQLSPLLLHPMLQNRRIHFQQSSVLILPFMMTMNPVDHYFGVQGSLQNRTFAASLTSSPPFAPGINHGGVHDTVENLRALQQQLTMDIMSDSCKGDGWIVVDTSQDHNSVTNAIHALILEQAISMLS